MSAKLSRCPFCGGKASIHNTDPKEHTGGYFVECAGCNASSKLVFALKDDVTRELTEAWNRRTLINPQSRSVL